MSGSENRLRYPQTRALPHTARAEQRRRRCSFPALLLLRHAAISSGWRGQCPGSKLPDHRSRVGRERTQLANSPSVIYRRTCSNGKAQDFVVAPFADEQCPLVIGELTRRASFSGEGAR